MEKGNCHWGGLQRNNGKMQIGGLKPGEKWEMQRPPKSLEKEEMSMGELQSQEQGKSKWEDYRVGVGAKGIVNVKATMLAVGSDDKEAEISSDGET